LATRNPQHKTAVRGVYFHQSARLAHRLPLQNRFKRLHDRDRVAVSGNIIVSEGPHLSQPPIAQSRGAAVFHESDLFEKPPQNFNAVAALRALAPGLHERAVVMMIRRVLQLAWSAPFDS